MIMYDNRSRKIKDSIINDKDSSNSNINAVAPPATVDTTGSEQSFPIMKIFFPLFYLNLYILR